MNNIECANFLSWLCNRLQNKYHEDEDIINKIKYILDNKKVVDDRISVKFIGALCNKYYPGFELEQTPDLKMGYSNEEKQEIYNLIS
ncbi:hypothetical protein EBZ38_16925, partial [bacterium]|nr:hypothetical protein [bacterium]